MPHNIASLLTNSRSARWLAATLALTSFPALSLELDKSQQYIRGGEVIVGFPGVVDITIIGSGGSGGSCTGSMISQNAVLTAAHCLNLLGAEKANDGVGTFVISYYDPERGRRQVFSGDGK